MMTEATMNNVYIIYGTVENPSLHKHAAGELKRYVQEIAGVVAAVYDDKSNPTLAVGEASVSAGLMGSDEVCSPVQMVIDNEIVGMLNAMLAPAAIVDDACAVDEIARVGPGGGYMGTDFTAERFRDALWGTQTWDAGPLAARGAPDAALERVKTFFEAFEPCRAIGADEERELMSIIARASHALEGK